MIRNGQYAHTECAELEEKRDKTDAELLDEYILNLFDLEYVPPRIQRQIASFINDYNFTHSGILKTLRYFYEVKRQDVKKANEGIGIVPWIYKKAYAYYKRMWDAVEKNKDKNVNLYQPKVEEIHVVPPEREAMRRKKRFRFLETDEVDEDAI